MALIHEKICAIQKEIIVIGKDSKNTQQNYMFRGIDTVYNELHSLFSKHEVFSVPEVLSSVSEERKSRTGSALIYRVLTIKYTFYASDGSSLSAVIIGEGMDSGDKASNKALSVAHKYALLQVFSVPTDEAKDPECDSHDIEYVYDCRKAEFISLCQSTGLDIKKMDRLVTNVNSKTIKQMLLDDAMFLQLKNQIKSGVYTEAQ